jgi:hypothetical protein
MLNQAQPLMVIDGIALAVISLLTSYAGAYFAGYIRKKGENRAMAENLDQLTRLVEDIKHEHAMMMERFRADQTHRFLAADKRLEAHQQAFIHWRAMWDAVRSPRVDNVTQQASVWWNEHCLYLDDPARKAFIQGISSIRGWWELTKPDNRQPEHEHEHVATADHLWNEFFKVPEAIFKAARVPELAPGELGIP